MTRQNTIRVYSMRDQIKQLTAERETLIADAIKLREQKENIWKAMALVENERDRLRAALENCKPVMESHAGTTRLALFNVALKEQL